jgi:hypothetical protein
VGGERRATHEVHLAAHAAVDLRANRLCADLPGEIDLNRGTWGLTSALIWRA